MGTEYWRQNWESHREPGGERREERGKEGREEGGKEGGERGGREGRRGERREGRGRGGKGEKEGDCLIEHQECTM